MQFRYFNILFRLDTASNLMGENYLASIDCPVDQPNKHMCERTCIRLAEITELIKKSNTKVNIIIIDACRKSFDRGSNNSFTHINAPEGTIIAFSTSPGEGASDVGMQGHSLYTGTLLQYIGRELLSVEELFKKTRKTVYNLSNGTQTSWEHTSLVGDFYFNTGQKIPSLNVSYEDSVVKDRYFINKGTEVDNIIMDLRSSDWNRQNPAINKLTSINPQLIDLNQQFILGRNILQCSGHAHAATDFLENLANNIYKYQNNQNNHVLNGMLFEIYFDNNGDFRRNHFKTNLIEKIFPLRNNPQFSKSFEFIRNVLKPYTQELYFSFSEKAKMIDVDISARESQIQDSAGNSHDVQVVDSITVNDKNITKLIQSICRNGRDLNYLKIELSEILVVPKELINIIENIEINKLYFK